MTINQRVVVIVLDGVGAGAAPDADLYGDLGSNSLSNVASKNGGLHLPNLEKIGFGHITPMMGVDAVRHPTGAYGKMTPKSAGKDSVTGHWELMGIYLRKAFPTYPHGFPKDVLSEFTRLTGLEVLGNKAASGTEIIKELGEEHMRTGKPIVYTSADSVFQIAAHEEVIPIDRLYEICKISRKMLVGEHAVGRVIARPFIGNDASDFQRTSRRHDYPRIPESDTVMDSLVKSGFDVLATGKIDDLFANRGITKSNHTTNNKDSIQAAIAFLKQDFNGLLFANLIEFDMIYGHRNDVAGYSQALEQFDLSIPAFQAKMLPGDIAMVVADHGVDPTTASTDHSREYSPLLVFGQKVKAGVNLGTRSTFADVAATIAEMFELQKPEIGTSFLAEIRESRGPN
ncbi:MAG: phosphopentomutase [Chloroflexi bacterium 44-23]|nr:MAG: phosphopentomutase [Chloroflexi bacterium 44-23]